MTKTLKMAVSNQKGGVGKTTSAINVAGALNELGADVLFVDLDPQGNATENLGYMEAYDADTDENTTLFDVLTNPEMREKVSEVIIEHEEMDLLPSHLDMTAIEPELTVNRRGGEQLAMVLDGIEDQYDYIIVDCPPYLGNLMDNALFATRNVLIPALAETTSKRAFELLYDHIGSLAIDYEIDVEDVGVIINRIDVRKTQATEMIEWIETAFDDVPVWRVRERADIQKSLDSGASLVQFAPDSDMADVYREIAADIDEVDA